MANLKTITGFKSRLSGGGARPNLFEVNINDFKLTDERMTRFVMTLEQSVDLVEHAI